MSELEAAIRLAIQCGEPDRCSLYDEEGVEGWKWTHPDGREWTEVGSWDEPPPLHPLVVYTMHTHHTADSSCTE